MIQQIILPKHNNRLEKELINLFHGLGMPMHFNHMGTKTFNNYQRIAVIILYKRSNKTLRDFAEEFNESKWMSWLGMKKAPKKSTIHDWLKLFGMKALRLMNSLVKPKNVNLAAIDGSGVDSWLRSRHYSKRIGEPNMPYTKIDLFIDVEKQMIIDFALVMKREHDAKSATRIFKRNNLEEITILGDGAYDSEPLHKLVRERGGELYAPVRRRNKRSIKKNPKGRYRKVCVNLPEFMGQRSIVETVISVLKRTQIISLRSRSEHMKQREFAWHIVLYNIKKKIRANSKLDKQTLIFLAVRIYLIPDRATFTYNKY